MDLQNVNTNSTDDNDEKGYDDEEIGTVEPLGLEVLSDDEVEDDDDETQQEKTPSGCCGKFTVDWHLGFFGLDDHNGNTIDVQETFAPDPYWVTLLAKFVLFGWPLQFFLKDILETDNKEFYFAYLSNWAIAMGLVYLLLSFIMSIFRQHLAKQPLLEQDEETGDYYYVHDNRPNFFVRLTWTMFSIASTSQLVATVLFWVMGSEAPVTYSTIMLNGGIMVVTLLEGFALNRIPVRIKHMLFPYLFFLAYLIWTLVQDATDTGNPNTEGDAIYDEYSWKNDPLKAGIVTIITFFGLIPAFFLLVWYASFWSFPCHYQGTNRRYLEFEGDEDEDEKVDPTMMEQHPGDAYQAKSWSTLDDEQEEVTTVE